MDNNTKYNVLGVCSFLGTSGYNYHARGFFTALNKYINVGIKNWSGDGNPYYLTDEHRLMMSRDKVLWEQPNTIDFVLHETNHEDWYKYQYKSPKIAFNVWESTRQPDGFFAKLNEFDQIWVPSTWQKDCTIEQGAPSVKVFVISEGINTERFNAKWNRSTRFKFASSNKFTFTIAGRWEYRKATTEMIRTFIEVFKDRDDVELLLLVDNPFDREKLTTEDKLAKNGLSSPKIRVLHKLSQTDYDILVRETDCLLSCSRAEGWNLPLQEFMACGVPAITSNWSAHLDFSKDYALLVNIEKLKVAQSDYGLFPGEYAEPDFKHLGEQMLEVVKEYDSYRKKALEGAKYMEIYTWDNAAKIAMKAIDKLIEKMEAPVEISETPVVDKSNNKVIDKKRSKDIFVIDCYPNSDEKEARLQTTIKYLKQFDKPIAVVTHYPVLSAEEIFYNVDYFVFDADNTLPDYRLPVVYTFENLKLSGRLDRPYHSLPIVSSLQNVCKMFSNFEKIHFIEYDINVDMSKHLQNVAIGKDKDFIGYQYEGTGVYTNIMTFSPSFMLNILTTRHIDWNEYKRMASPLLWEHDLVFENWMYKVINNLGKAGDTLVLNSKSVDMRADAFKELPIINCIFSKTTDGNNILFIAHHNLPADKFKLTMMIGTIDLNIPLVSDESYSFAIFKESVSDVSVYYEDKRLDFKISEQPVGEFIFFDKDIKCKKVDKLAEADRSHNVSIKNFFIHGPFVEINGPENENTYHVEFTDKLTGYTVHQTDLKINHWTRANRQYYTDWHIKVNCGDEILYDREISLFKRRVMIVIDTKAMGDTLAFFPVIEEFRKKHNCQVIAVTFWNQFFRDTYPEITFVEPGSSVPDIFCQIGVGCFDGQLDKNKFNWRITPLQKVATDILGIKYKEIIPNIAMSVKERPIEGKYVTLSEFSTFHAKFWHYQDKQGKGGWQIVVDYLNSKGYRVAVISKESTNLKNIVDLTNRPIDETLNNIHHAEMHMGVSSGPSWIAWALRRPLVLISGYSAKWAEMDPDNPLVERVINEDVCHGCFNDPSLPLDRGNWRWCPRNRDFECSKLIHVDTVIESVNKLLNL